MRDFKPSCQRSAISLVGGGMRDFKDLAVWQ
jgi:hypothetical protein